ncbi:unnamed protein product [Prorocentrum cordatum]|uniref:Band 7 domain-containing protein n=1 Tax=Prorocentrum cordatum TaxID=2364126 RepID=A0ABN9XTL4_9DINO|nr:unnamed protein product [Polarella glacialis]
MRIDAAPSPPPPCGPVSIPKQGRPGCGAKGRLAAETWLAPPQAAALPEISAASTARKLSCYEDLGDFDFLWKQRVEPSQRLVPPSRGRRMWDWLLQRGPEYLAQGVVNYAARCPAIPACPQATCPSCPGLTCGDCVVPACPACPACRPITVPAGAAAFAEAAGAREEAASCAEPGLGYLAYLIFLLGVVVGGVLTAGGLAVGGLLRRLCCRPVKPLWHQRRVYGVVAHSGGKTYVAATADAHVYPEDWSPTSEDVLAVRWCSEFRELPAGPVVGAGGTGAIVPAGAGPPGAPPVPGVAQPAPAGAAGAPAAAAAPPPVLVGPLQGVAPAAPAAGVGTSWRAAESGGGFRFGDPVPGHARSAQAIGSKDFHLLPDGTALFVEEVTAATEVAFLDKGVFGDARIMAVRRNRQGRRERTWAEMVAAAVQEEFSNDWDLPGPRSVLWCLEFINHEGLGLDGHHERFRVQCKLEFSSWGVSEHYNVTQALKFGLLHDRLDGTNLMMVEPMLRRLQTIEFAHSERAREQEAKGYGGKLSLEEQMAFAGTARAGGSLMICPLLLDYVRGEVEREASLAKNLRKAREERDAARAKDKTKKDAG